MNSEPTEVLNECDGNAIAVLSKNTLVYYAVPIGLFEKMLAAYDASLFNLIGS
jgi:prephenate dehydrogenase